MKIEKRNYSKSPWRLVNDEGKEISAKMPFEHPSLGWTYIDAPVCGETKAECVQKSLELLRLCLFRPQAQQPLTDEELIECERLADIRYRKHMSKHIGSIRSQQLSPADKFLWHFARAVEAAHGIGEKK